MSFSSDVVWHKHGEIAGTAFCLVTPNWSVQLPGYSYDGTDPDGFMPRRFGPGFFETVWRRATEP
jgi:putative flavoprotein involved in K+ transport